MDVVVFSAHKFEIQVLEKSNAGKHQLKLLDVQLSVDTAHLASGARGVSLFVNDDCSAKVLDIFKQVGIEFIVLRSAGFNHVDLVKAAQLHIRVARVPAYSPYAVAEHTVALMLALNRRLIRANNRVMDSNFSLEGLTGFDMNGKTAGIIGTGQIGAVVAKILSGFGCHIIASDPNEDQELKEKYNIDYTSKEVIFEKADLISLHIPLSPVTRYMINATVIGKMKKGVMIINTSRGALLNTKDVIRGLKSGHIGYLGIDVYEEEAGLFFEDHSDEILQDDVIARLMTFPNVLITSHQAFLTHTALENIADSTIKNLDCFEMGIVCENELVVKDGGT